MARLLDTASKFVLFLASGLKDKKLIKKQAYTKTETCKLYYRVFWIFQPNLIKIDRYNFELCRFKVDTFFLKHSVVLVVLVLMHCLCAIGLVCWTRTAHHQVIKNCHCPEASPKTVKLFPVIYWMSLICVMAYCVYGGYGPNLPIVIFAC